MSVNNKTVLFFDWDGTLADSMDVCVEANRLTMERMNLPAVSEETMRKCNGPTYEESAVIMGIPENRKEEYIQVRRNIELEILPKYQKLYEGIHSMLSKLRNKASLVIVSNGLDGYLSASLRILGLEDYFSYVQGSVLGKSKAENLSNLLKNMEPTTAIFIGDKKNDIIAGKVNNLTTIAACYGYGKESEWVDADFCAKSVYELEDILKRLI